MAWDRLDPRGEGGTLLATALLQAQSARALVGLQIDMLGFARHRIDVHLETLDRLLAAERMEEAQEVFLRFAHETAVDYLAQGCRMAERSVRLATPGGDALRKDAARATDEMVSIGGERQGNRDILA